MKECDWIEMEDYSDEIDDGWIDMCEQTKALRAHTNSALLLMLKKDTV